MPETPVPGYEPPKIERVLSAEELGREFMLGVVPASGGSPP